MKRTILSVTALTFALSGCMGGGETQEEELQAEAKAQAASSNSGLQFSYPIKGQAGFPTSAPMIVQFGMPITASEGELGPSNIGLAKESDNGFESLSPERVEALIDDIQIVGDGRTLRINTTEDLQPGARYRLQVTGVSLEEGLADTSRIEFTTASNRSTGTVNQRLDAEAEGLEDFRVARLVPFSAEVDGSSLGEGSSNFPFTNFNTLRVQFTQPVDEDTVSYGDQGSVQLRDSDGNLVEDAELWVRGNRMVIDPEGVLKAGDTYKLSFSDQLTSSLSQTPIAGDSSWSFMPQEARIITDDGLVERDILAQEAVMGSDSEAVDYTGEDYNSVVLGATTLGQGNQTVQSGTVNAYMGHTQRFEGEGKAIPLTVKQGTLMKGTSVDVLVGGELQTEFEESGEIDVRFLSDANGYMMMNPYSDSPSAPRVVRLFADLAMNTEKPRANGALAQELLHVELVGTATVEDDKLTLKAVSVIEPDVLGVDKASGLISFRLEAYNDPDDAPAGLADSTGPQLKAWTPGGDSASGLAFESNQDKMQPQDPITLFFDEPLLPSSVNSENVTLTEDSGGKVAAEVRLNGPNVIVDPEKPLSYASDYTLTVNDGVTDLSGASLERGMLTLPFSLPETDQEVPSNVGPVALTTRPGYPCAKADLSETTFDESEGNGRCLGGMTAEGGDQTSDWITRPEDDDLLPIEEHGSEEPIIVRFSQNMNKSTMTKKTSESAGNIHVEKYEGSEWSTVDGYIVEASARSLKLIPEEGWEVGGVYRYTLTDGLTSEANNPLYTKLLAQFDGDGNGIDGRNRSDLVSGGHSLVNRFQVVKGDKDVLTPLSNFPTNDVNSDFAITAPEERAPLDSDGESSAVANSGKVLYREGSLESGLVEDANIGCQAQGDQSSSEWNDCPRDKFIYKTALLDVELLEEIPRSGEVAVKLDPSILLTDPLAVHVFIPTLEMATLGIEEPHHSIMTGPQVMRMRYEKDEEGKRTEKITGKIARDSEGQLIFKTELDVYFDAPFMAPDIPLTELDHNMRSFKINDLKLQGDITFFEDGRMQIEQRNVDPVYLSDVVVDGDTLEGLGDFLGLGPRTEMDLFIPPGELYLNYITPYTQKRE